MKNNFIAPIICLTLGAFAGSVLAVAQQPPPEPPPATRTDAPPYSPRGADTCIRCHDDAEVLAVFKTRHGRRTDARSPFGHGNLQCEACHGPGGTHARRVRSGQEQPPIPHFGFNSPSSASESNDRCLACHRRDMKHGWQGSGHQREGLTCASCHRMHLARDPVLIENAQPQVCFECHRQ